MLLRKNSYQKIEDDKYKDKNKNKIMAKYKNKYYSCKILEKNENTSKVLFIASKYKTIVNNKDILF